LEYDAKWATFFRLAYGSAKGFACIAHFSQGSKTRKFSENFFYYPDNLDDMVAHLGRLQHGSNVYFCPQLFSARKRTKETCVSAPSAWADLDTCHPELLLVQPTVIIESSSERYQALWCMERAQEPEEAQDISRRIAYKHADQGCDRSGWDITQLLRVPYTFNYKYDPPVQVQIKSVSAARFRPTDFDEYPQAEGFQYLDIPMPENLEGDSDAILQGYRFKINPLVWRLYGEVPEGTWSEDLWKLTMLLLEAGLSREETYIVVNASACNKYRRDNKASILLWKEVCRAWSKVEERNNPIIPSNSETKKPLLTDEERSLVLASPCFVERYIEWAKGLGDAAWQYHQAGAFTVLSSLLAGTVRLPTSFGTVIPNLWFMILADTTITRKSTAMDIAMELVMDTDSDAILATDGSIEGLMTSLSMRPGRPSIFLRDEFSGLLEAMTKKDYMAGMAETLTKLYDGKFQKRILKKEIIEVREPVLIMFAGGIKNRICSLLSYEHVSSGFMPRFIFVTAESDVTKLKPLGPPTAVDMSGREKILAELYDIYGYYHKQGEIAISAGQLLNLGARRWDAKLTGDAWIRYNKFEADMVRAALESTQTELLMPTFDRLAKSGLKAAVLLAAARQRAETFVEVTEADVVHAFFYIEQWRLHTIDVINNVGKSGGEKQLDTVLRAIQKKPGITRSTLMQHYHLDARGATGIFETLEQRGLITRQRIGRGEAYFPTGTGAD
jgi:RepB DNA-primase from phage plasmid/Protein of unknown function (DUF3987)